MEQYNVMVNSEELIGITEFDVPQIGQIAPFYILSNSLFTSHPIIRRRSQSPWMRVKRRPRHRHGHHHHHHHYHHHHHHHHHHHIACKVVGLMTTSGPINSLEVFWRFVLGFVSNTVDITIKCGCLSVCLCPLTEHVVSIYFCDSEFSLQLG